MESIVAVSIVSAVSAYLLLINPFIEGKKMRRKVIVPQELLQDTTEERVAILKKEAVAV